MLIALDAHPIQRRSKGGTHLGRYSSSIIPPLRTARDIFLVFSALYTFHHYVVKKPDALFYETECRSRRSPFDLLMRNQAH